MHALETTTGGLRAASGAEEMSSPANVTLSAPPWGTTILTAPLRLMPDIVTGTEASPKVRTWLLESYVHPLPAPFIAEKSCPPFTVRRYPQYVLPFVVTA